MTPLLEGWPTKAKEAPSPHDLTLAPSDTNAVFHYFSEKQHGPHGALFIFHMHRYNHQDLFIRPYFHQDKALKYKALKTPYLSWSFCVIFNLFLKENSHNNYNSQK